jgi:hypothetical protein
MQSFYLNIGLNVRNIEPQTQLSRTIRGLLNNKELSSFHDIKVVESTYKGKRERTLYVLLDNFLDCDILHLQTIISMLAKDLQQESIAFYHPEHKELIYNPDYKGEKLVFDMQYFKF